MDGAPGGSGGEQAPKREWRGELLAPKIPKSDTAACVYATFCPCATFGETYQRAFNLPHWTTVAHAILWFFGLSALWIADAAIAGDCAAISKVSFPLPPPGVRVIDMQALRTSNYTRGYSGNNLTPVFSNATLTAAYAAKVEAAVSSATRFSACQARYSPTLTGVFLITAATLGYGAWRRRQLRRKFGLPGDDCGDCMAWFFCTQCAMCQEYRTVRMNNVDNGEWGGTIGWLLDGTAVPTSMQKPADLEMV